MKDKLRKLQQMFQSPKNLTRCILWMYKQALPLRKSLLLMTGIDLLILVIGFGISFVSKNTVDLATTGHPFTVAFGIMIAFTVLSITISAIFSLLCTRINENLSFSIRQKVFDRILSVKYLALNRYHSSDLLTRLTSDADSIASTLSSVLPELAMIFVQLTAAFILLYRFSPFLAIVALLLAPAGLMISLLSGAKFKHMSLQLKESESAYRSFIQEQITHIDVVKAFCMEKSSFAQMCSLRQRILAIILRRNQMSALSGAVLRILASLGYLTTFGYCIIGLHNGSLTYGTMTLFLSLFSQIQMPFMNLSRLMPQAINALASADRIMELNDLPEDPRNDAHAQPAEVQLSFDDVSFSYDDHTPVLQHISFTANSGNLTGIMGASGVGKTTLIRLVLALASPTSGRVLFRYDGTEEVLAANSRRLIAYVPQGNTLVSGSIRDNLRWGNPSASDAELYQALSDADADFVYSLPYGLDTVIGEKSYGLSEGQAQRIAIARALLRHSPVLILDEATSALDEKSEQSILSRLSSPDRSYTPLCLIITHRRSMIPYFDQLLELQEGGRIQIRKEH